MRSLTPLTPAAILAQRGRECLGRLYLGTARLASDRQVPATETSFRGPGYALVAEVEVDRRLFGTAPADTVVLHGQTSRPPEHRVGPHEDRFPPDRLRSVSYWDQAPQDNPTLVLCLLSDPVVVRLCWALTTTCHAPSGSFAPGRSRVPARRWSSSNSRARTPSPPCATSPASSCSLGRRVTSRSSSSGSSGCPVVRTRRPGNHAARATAQRPAAGQQTGGAGAGRLLHVMADERGPEGLVSYLTWFDAHRDRLARAESELAGKIRAQAELVGRRDFAGPDAQAWRQEVRRHARTLAEGDGG